MTFKDYLKQRQYAPTTIINTERMVLDFITWLDMENMEAEQVQSRDILGYIKYKQKKELSQSSMQGYVNAIKLFYAYKIHTRATTTNPARHIKIQGIQRKKLYYIFTPEELNRIYNNYQPEQIKKQGGRSDKEHLLIERRNKAMLGLFVYQGIDSGELIKLETKHIKLREGKIEIPGGRRSEGRTLQLESHQILDLYDYILQIRPQILNISKQETEKLFITIYGGSQRHNITQTLLRELKRQNKQVVNMQQIRASVIVKWLKQYNLREAQYRAGHRYISSTESYLVNEVEGLQEEVSQYHPLG